MSQIIVNMLMELRLPPIKERICSNVTRFTVKCHYNHIATYYSQIIKNTLRQRQRDPPFQAGCRTLIKNVSRILQTLNIDIPEAEPVAGPPPWMIPSPTIHYTPTTKTTLTALKKQLALETISNVSSSGLELQKAYTDGSLQPDRSVRWVFSPDPPQGGWVRKRLPDSSRCTYCELHGILHTIRLIYRKNVITMVINDSKPALRLCHPPSLA